MFTPVDAVLACASLHNDNLPHVVNSCESPSWAVSGCIDHVNNGLHPVYITLYYENNSCMFFYHLLVSCITKIDKISACIINIIMMIACSRSVNVHVNCCCVLGVLMTSFSSSV